MPSGSRAAKAVPLTKKPNPEVWQPKIKSVTQRNLRGFDNFTGFNAARADLHPAVCTGRKLNANRLQVGIKTPTGLIVGVRNVITKLRPFAADITSLSHNIAPLQKEGNRLSFKTQNEFYNKLRPSESS
jgi:hypothetical protein